MLETGVRCVEGCCLWIQSSGQGPEHFVGDGLWRPLLDIGAQSSSGSETAGFTLLSQLEKLLSQLVLKSRCGHSPWGGRGTDPCSAASRKKISRQFLLLLPPGGSPWTYRRTCHTASFGGLLDARRTNLLFFVLGPRPPPHVPNLYAPFTWLSPHSFPQGPYCLHSVHNSLCLSVPITSHWDSRLPTGESQPYLSF